MKTKGLLTRLPADDEDSVQTLPGRSAGGPSGEPSKKRASANKEMAGAAPTYPPPPVAPPAPPRPAVINYTYDGAGRPIERQGLRIYESLSYADKALFPGLTPGERDTMLHTRGNTLSVVVSDS
jgi:hypothetical protein